MKYIRKSKVLRRSVDTSFLNKDGYITPLPKALKQKEPLNY